MSDHAIAGQKRVEFAHLLRGIASVCVVLDHFFGVFFLQHDAIADLMGLPPIVGLRPLGWPASIIAGYSTLLGQFGVGVFFMISGFVIPFSMPGNSSNRFLALRALRIYPVYIVGFGIVVISVALANGYAGTPFPYGFWRVFWHFGILTRGLFGVPRIDGISWTLEVELSFYIVIAIVGLRATRFGMRPLLAVAVALFAVGIVIIKTQGILLGEQAWAALLLILGLAYHSAYTGKLGLAGLLLLNVTIAALLSVEWKFIGFPRQWVGGYFLAMAIFGCCFAAQKHIGKIGVLSHFADISYPLYVVHCLTGYALIYVLIRSGAPVVVALATALISVYLLAVLIHYGVERPIARFARRPRLAAPAEKPA